jgi:hypothetical protein
MLAQTVCPKLPDSAKTGSILNRIQTAAEKLQDDDLFPDLNARQLKVARECIETIKARKRELGA